MNGNQDMTSFDDIKGYGHEKTSTSKHHHPTYYGRW